MTKTQALSKVMALFDEGPINRLHGPAAYRDVYNKATRHPPLALSSLSLRSPSAGQPVPLPTAHPHLPLSPLLLHITHGCRSFSTTSLNTRSLDQLSDCPAGAITYPDCPSPTELLPYTRRSQGHALVRTTKGTNLDLTLTTDRVE